MSNQDNIETRPISDITFLDKPEEYNPKNFTFFKKPTYYDISEMRLEGLRKTAEIIQWGRRNPIKFCERFFGIEFLDYQKYVFMMSWITPQVVWCMSRSAGKALDLSTRIPTPNGDKIMKDIHVGDYVFDENGNPTLVTYESPVYINHQCYEVTFDDGEKIIADADHNWYVTAKLRTTDENGCVIKTTEEMYKNYIHKYGDSTRKKGCIEYRYRVFRSGALQYKSNIKLPIDPYILGLWLGDGKVDDGYINVSILDSEETIKNIQSVGYKIYSITKDRDTQYRLRIHLPDDTPLKVALRENGLLGNKYIPTEYLYTSVDNRIKLLQGLMDTDGYIDKTGRCEFSQCKQHVKIIDGMHTLLTSLGIKNNITNCKKKCGNTLFDTYKIHFITDKSLPAFKMERKYVRLRDSIKNDKTNKKSIIKIEKVESRPVKCIQVASDSHLYLCGKNNTITHNTTLGSPFLMAKTLLVPKFEGYILSGTGAQSIGMMKKIEAIAKKEIASFTGLTDVFLAELYKTNISDGFIHNPASYSYKLWSGSSISTINSNYDGARGRRSRLNFYDEASYVPEDMFAATLPFVTQNSDFALGGNVDITLVPPNFPNQVVYASSAGSTDDVFYKRYKEFSMHSMAGDKRYFVADIDCDVILNATYNGKKYPVPLLTQEKIDSEMKLNPVKAIREYKNKFDTDLGEGQIVKKSLVIKNSFVRPPVLANDTGKRLFSIAFDPARKKDNSAVTVGEFIYDENKGWRMDIVNCINLVDITTKKRIPLETPKQIQRLKQLVLNYNGEQIGDYSNIRHFLIDAGAGGGGGTSFTDLLFEDWYEDGHVGDDSYLHRGFIDPEYSKEYVNKYPNAAKILKVLEPAKVKVPAFLALIDLIEQGLITFTADYDYHGYLTMLDNTNEENSISEHVYKLSIDEEESLAQIDALKEELTHMYRYKSSNKRDRFDLAPGCSNLLGDDRVYTLALLALDLYELRREHITNKKRPTADSSLISRLPMGKGKRFSSLS